MNLFRCFVRGREIGFGMGDEELDIAAIGFPQPSHRQHDLIERHLPGIPLGVKHREHLFSGQLVLVRAPIRGHWNRQHVTRPKRCVPLLQGFENAIPHQPAGLGSQHRNEHHRVRRLDIHRFRRHADQHWNSRAVRQRIIVRPRQPLIKIAAQPLRLLTI